MAQLYPVAGSKIFIGQRVAPKGVVTIADFTGQSWTEIGGWASAGAIGDTQEVITQNLINEGRTRKMKGTRNGGAMENQFVPDATDAGQIAFRAAIDDCNPYAFKIEWGASCPRTSTVTITIDEPGVVSWTAHGLANGTPVTFTTTGTLPTGLTAGTIYYVVGATEDTFSVAATPGGTAIETTASQSGVHTATAGELGMTDLFFGLALPGARQGGEANTTQLRAWTIEVDSNIVEV
ncbi:MAG: hypothetical protein M0R28_20165 [Pigmentiphaga sp.]|nr:hypothetical protein [Pigmentiphaga sp.]